MLIESYKDGVYHGYDQFFNPIEVVSQIDITGDWIIIDDYEIKGKINVSKF